MKLIIDTTKGIAGDIVSAGLLALGADTEEVISSMECAGGLLGSIKVNLVNTDGISKLDIRLVPDSHHVSESRMRSFLDNSLRELNTGGLYGDIALNILDVLCRAERHVHSHDRRLMHMKHNHGGETVLHEVQDIIIDIIGLIAGLKSLKITGLGYLNYVNAGGSSIEFSHGRFEVPVPAARYIFDEYGIKWKKSDAKTEAATPTGVSILAGSGAENVYSLKYKSVIKNALAGGTRGLEPVPFYLVE